MKKLISLILATVMVLSTMVMLIPVASAAETVDPSANGGAGKVYYEQNFDDPALAGLVDYELSAALGWTTPSETSTMLIEDGALRIVNQYTANGVYPPTVKSYGSGYATRWLRDDDLAQNATVVEYTVISHRRAADPANDRTVTLADGTTKTIKADGQGNYQGFGAYMEGWSGTDNYLIRFNPDGKGNTATTKQYDTPSNAANRGDIYWKSGAVTRVSNAIDEGDTYTLEYVDNPIGTEADSAKSGKYYNTEYHIKHIVEPHANRCYTFINGVLFEATNPDGVYGQYTTNAWRQSITKYLGFHAKPGVDVTLDDIKVSEYVPALTISEVMANGIATGNAKGKYQWVEITNPGDAPVNVYDYALHTCMGNNAKTIGDEVVMYEVGSGSTIGYFTPGAKAVGNYTFDSPAYADGVLQPGESAVVLIPYTAIQGGLDTSDEAFRTYLKGLGMPETTKTFVADNKSANPFLLNHMASQNFAISILKVENKATEGYDPQAVAFGQNTWYINAFAECTVILTAKTSGGTNFFGLRLYEATYDSANKKWVDQNKDLNSDGFMGHVPLVALNTAAYNTPATDHSYEINYSGWYAEAPHASIQWGFAKYRPDMARKGIAGTDVYTTPGFVPVDCRRTVDVTLVKDGKTEGIQGARLLTDSTVSFTAPAAKDKFAIDAYLDGALYASDVAAASAVSFNVAGSKLTNASNLDVEFKYRARCLGQVDGHEVEFANYDAAQHSGVCAVCGDTIYAPHAWDDGVVAPAPTCEAEGVKTFNCTVCDATKTETVAANGHDYGNWTYVDEAQHAKYCANDCGETIYADHAWNEGVVTTAPTCEADGVKTYTCADCGTTKTETLPATGHAYGDWTYVDEAQHAKYCANDCGEDVYENHSYANRVCVGCGCDQPVDFKLYVDDADGVKGHTLQVTVRLEKNPGIAGIILTLDYDTTALRFVSAENGSIISNLETGVNLLFSNEGGVDSTEDGVLVTLTFEALQAGSFKVGATVHECANEALEEVAIDTFSGTVTVVPFLYGDANNDGRVDLNDSIRLRVYFADYDYETDASTIEIGEGADANGDGVVNLKDLILVTTYLAYYDYDTNTPTIVLGPNA